MSTLQGRLREAVSSRRLAIDTVLRAADCVSESRIEIHVYASALSDRIATLACPSVALVGYEWTLNLVGSPRVILQQSQQQPLTSDCKVGLCLEQILEQAPDKFTRGISSHLGEKIGVNHRRHTLSRREYDCVYFFAGPRFGGGKISGALSTARLRLFASLFVRPAAVR